MKHITQSEWKIQLTMAINFISSKDSEGTRTMHTKSNNVEIMMGSETDEINYMIVNLLYITDDINYSK